MINYVFFFLISLGLLTAMLTGNLNEVSNGIFQSAMMSIELSIKLLGPMILWLGILNIARESGFTKLIARFLKPIIKILFPDLPENNPAAGSILMNLSANILGLGNAATPLGIKAMQDLQKINDNKERATPGMCTLLALNTSSVTLIPATIISLRAAAGSNVPAVITVSTIFATLISTVTAIIVDRFMQCIDQECE